MPNQTLSTQQFVDIKEVKGGVLYLKGGGIRRVLAVGGINFDLKSQEEQEVILHSFQNFLNTLDFSIQIFIHSRKVNVQSYLQKIEERKAEEQNELLKIQIGDYIEFVKTFVRDNPIVTKTFFIVVPYETPKASAPTKGLLGFFKKKPASKAKTDERMEHQKQTFQLGQRVDEVIQGLGGIGVHAQPLEDEEITELFYNLYNPALIEKEDLAIAQSPEAEEQKKNPKEA
ncbi:hypothetical protein CL629_01895 [bacterium]|nr:hypothetical protein [bacterium]|tara:strand:+ start:2544 stop:3230 length:687 start_codon:yes stop_codon:yes gene_type:complete